MMRFSVRWAMKAVNWTKLAGVAIPLAVVGWIVLSARPHSNTAAPGAMTPANGSLAAEPGSSTVQATGVGGSVDGLDASPPTEPAGEAVAAVWKDDHTGPLPDPRKPPPKPAP